MDVIRERHSVRQYTEKKIEREKREQLDALVTGINAAAGSNIQILYDEPKCFTSMMARYGKFDKVGNYIALVAPNADGMDEKMGYYGEKIVLKAQELGLNTCWVALTHGKSAAKVEKGEKEYCLIALGYGATQGASRTTKAIGEVCSCADSAPEWFRVGIEAALLAPTAMNQQKFYFTLQGDTVTAKVKGAGFHTKMDLGIVKYHFELASGHKVS